MKVEIEWKPIKDIPDAFKDGRWLLLYYGSEIGVLQGRWGDSNGRYVKHWQVFGERTAYDPIMYAELPTSPAPCFHDVLLDCKCGGYPYPRVSTRNGVRGRLILCKDCSTHVWGVNNISAITLWNQR